MFTFYVWIGLGTALKLLLNEHSKIKKNFPLMLMLLCCILLFLVDLMQVLGGLSRHLRA